MVNEKRIAVSKYVYFSEEFGRFLLTYDAQQKIYREKELICSYSGSNDWCNHFVCEMIDLCSGSSIYNYALGTFAHEKEIPEIWRDNKESVITWVNKSMELAWGKKMYELIDRIIDEVEAT